MALALVVACGPAAVDSGTVPAEVTAPAVGPQPALFLATARFEQPTPAQVTLLPARVLVVGADGAPLGHIEDPASNVFHKAVPWRGGLLTIGAERARVVAWTRGGGEPVGSVLWETTFGGKFDRMRDVEEADVDGDGAVELVVVTHDQGVVAIGDENAGTWSWTEIDRRPNTFVHEVEIGDLDGNGTPEIYVTPSDPNAATGASQPGAVVRYDRGPTGWVSSPVIAWPDTHAKEILVADVGDGPWLMALREGRTGPAGALADPVAVVRLVPGEAGFREEVIAVLSGERQARFLVAGDLDGDGNQELVATGMDTGVWRIDKAESGFVPVQVDGSSGGFEQAAHLADLDSDGRPELYVASERPDRPRELRRYSWSPTGAMSRTVLAQLPGQGLVWGISSGVW
jgi:hypothetical protein